jgi:hypothetical protein
LHVLPRQQDAITSPKTFLFESVLAWWHLIQKAQRNIIERGMTEAEVLAINLLPRLVLPSFLPI